MFFFFFFKCECYLTKNNCDRVLRRPLGGCEKQELSPTQQASSIYLETQKVQGLRLLGRHVRLGTGRGHSNGQSNILLGRGESCLILALSPTLLLPFLELCPVGGVWAEASCLQGYSLSKDDGPRRHQHFRLDTTALKLTQSGEGVYHQGPRSKEEELHRGFIFTIKPTAQS